jgi:uncharacterized membrane protein YraQ (UPF0718 family)
MLAAPIINPIVILSTLYAFPGQPEIALIRVGCGLAIALITGAVLHIFPKRALFFIAKSRSAKGITTHIYRASAAAASTVTTF